MHQAYTQARQDGRVLCLHCKDTQRPRRRPRGRLSSSGQAQAELQAQHGIHAGQRQYASAQVSVHRAQAQLVRSSCTAALCGYPAAQLSSSCLAASPARRACRTGSFCVGAQVGMHQAYTQARQDGRVLCLHCKDTQRPRRRPRGRLSSSGQAQAELQAQHGIHAGQRQYASAQVSVHRAQAQLVRSSCTATRSAPGSALGKGLELRSGSGQAAGPARHARRTAPVCPCPGRRAQSAGPAHRQRAAAASLAGSAGPDPTARSSRAGCAATDHHFAHRVKHIILYHTWPLLRPGPLGPFLAMQNIRHGHWSACAHL